ncbi:MAG: nucleotide exchange factor GrpE [Candidatus Levybacteria bacterium]|nr:nucleotide exchange factor GrpE [Candidatus Levybacteria bacterium]
MDKNDKKVKKDERVLLKEKIEELENQVKRTLADYRNLENRVGQERGEWILKANKQLLLNILPVLDTLMLTAKHRKDQSSDLGIQQFLDILKKEGVVGIETMGADFDPNLMEGIATVEGEDGKVIEETRAGYMLYDKVLRPAQVKVGGGK